MELGSQHGQNSQREDRSDTSSVVSDGLSQHFSESGKSDIAETNEITPPVADGEDDDGPDCVFFYARDETPVRTIGSAKTRGHTVFLNQYGPNKSPIYRFELTKKGNPTEIPELSGSGNQVVLVHNLKWENVRGVSAVATEFDDMNYLGPDYFEATKGDPVYVRLKLEYSKTNDNGGNETVCKSYWVPRWWVRQHYKNPNANIESKLLRSIGKEQDADGHANKAADELLLHVGKVTGKRFKAWEKPVITEGREDSPDKTPEPAWVPGGRIGRSRREETKVPPQVLATRSRSYSQSSASSTDSSQRSTSPEPKKYRKKKHGARRARTPAEMYAQAKKISSQSSRDAAAEARSTSMKLLTDQYTSQMEKLALG